MDVLSSRMTDLQTACKFSGRRASGVGCNGRIRNSTTLARPMANSNTEVKTTRLDFPLYEMANSPCTVYPGVSDGMLYLRTEPVNLPYEPLNLVAATAVLHPGICAVYSAAARPCTLT